MKLDYTEFVYFKKIFIFWNKKDDTAQQNLEQLLMQIQLGSKTNHFVYQFSIFCALM